MKYIKLFSFSILFVAIIIGRGLDTRAAGFLSVRGFDTVDEDGRKVLLRGVGLGNWMLPEGYMWLFAEHGDRPRKIEKLVSDLIGDEAAREFWTKFRRNYITERDIERIAELGFNSVRPALNARLFLTEDANPEFVQEGFELLDNLVAWCKKHHIYVIIDMHGAPGGQTGANIDDSRNDEPELFTDKKYQDRLVDLWVRIADRYKDEPTVAAYDLLNEPLPERTGAAAKHKRDLEPLYERITKAIRSRDKRHIITLEGADWSNDWSVFSKPFDERLIYQFHYYCWDSPTQVKSIEPFLNQRRTLGRPVWVGETGEKDNTIYSATTDYFETHNIGWSFWPWKKMVTKNTPYSIKAPANWGAIQAYSRGEAKPSQEVAAEAFGQLVENVKIENCDYFPDVVHALFRRAPCRIEAENYGFEGPEKSYSVKAPENSRFYRQSERVPVQLIHDGSEESPSGQGIMLGTDEWTAYSISSLTERNYNIIARVKAEQLPAALQVEVNGEVQSDTLNTDGWVETQLRPARLKAGTNRIKLSVAKGSIQCDWLELK
jgi:aryl-phospho-beta-D-glucosidase BglC (GH1 family)